MGKIADAWVEIGAKTSAFKGALQDLVYEFKRISFNIRENLKDAFSAENVGNLVGNLTGSGDAGWVASSLIKAGFGKALLAVTAVSAAVVATSLALDALFSRDDDQKFADSVAGLTSGFRGLSEQIKHTDKKIQDIMSRDATGGNGGWFSLSSWKALGERVIGVETMSSQIARNMNNAVTASKLFADNMVRAAIAGQQQSDQKLGAQAAAGMLKTAGMREEERISTEAFKRVVDVQGGARIFEQLREEFRKNPAMMQAGQSPKEAAQMAFGQLARGEQAATKLFGNLFDLPAERAKVLGEEFDQATGAAGELARMEQERIAKEKEFADARLKLQQRETEQAAKDMIKLEEQQATMTERLAQFQADRAEQLKKSFQFAGLSEARDRLFMAAQDAKKDELTASKMQGEIDKVVKALDKLQMKWNMVG